MRWQVRGEREQFSVWPFFSCSCPYAVRVVTSSTAILPNSLPLILRHRSFLTCLRHKFLVASMSAVDDVFESWEEMEESGALDKKLKALEVNPVDGLENEPRNKDCNSETRIIILGDQTMQSQYAPKPTVKILKRPDRNSQGDGPLLNGDKPKQPIKSLKQREQEYAEARKRILGEEKSPEEKLVTEVNRIQGKPLLASGSNLPMNITRIPTGPDGTKGFNVRR